MIFFLRNQNNKTVFEVEIWINKIDDYSFVEISPSVNIENYSFMLLNSKQKFEMIADFDELEGLRGWLWEVFFAGKKNEAKYYDEIIEELRGILQEKAEKYNLILVQD